MNMTWRSEDTGSDLLRHSLHIWRAPLEVDDATEQRMRVWLSADEIARADRFRFEKHRRRFTVARGLLRWVLGQYLGEHPSRIEFFTTSYGKPYLKRMLHTSELCFNISHSHEMALIGVGRDCRIGIDIEYKRKIIDIHGIANHFFSEAEVAALNAVPAELQSLAFLNCWTRKEAYIKGIGDGLSHPLSEFTVAFAPDAAPALLADVGDPAAVDRWQLFALDTHPDYVSAVAVEYLAQLRQPLTIDRFEVPSRAYGL